MQVSVSGEVSDGDSVDSILSWVDTDAYEVSQTCSVENIVTPDQEENEEIEPQ